MKQFNHINRSYLTALAFYAATGAAMIGCKESPSEQVREAREKTAEKQEGLLEAQRELQQARAELAKARAEFVVASNERLAQLDAKIAELRQNRTSKIDWAKIDELRASADRLRTEVGNNARVFAQDVRADFDRLVSEIERGLDMN